jgi:hypothetical protein
MPEVALRQWMLTFLLRGGAGSHATASWRDRRSNG